MSGECEMPRLGDMAMYLIERNNRREHIDRARQRDAHAATAKAAAVQTGLCG